MDSATRDTVRGRAAGFCEYCRLPEWAHDRTFHVEHIIAQQHGGSDDVENLALACDRCNLHKGPNLSGIDPLSSEVVPLFHPRHHSWNIHFCLRSSVIEGLSPTGRATVRLLQMNVWRRVRLQRKIGMVDAQLR